MLSDAVPFGAVQVPADQQPILLMADRQTTGGYPKIAVVISADLPLAAQLLPGDSLRFAIITQEEAWAALRDQRAALDAALPPVNH
jgi:antagonist of KipI